MKRNNLKMPVLSKIAAMLTAILFFTSSIIISLTVNASEPHPVRVVDEADILLQSEETNLLRVVDEISERQQFDVVVVTVESLGGEDIQYYAADYYDYNGYGMGDNYDGAMFIISMEEREWFVLTTGYGIDVLTDAEIDDMSQNVVPYLSSGDYETAFEMFAVYCDKQINYDRGLISEEPQEEDGVYEDLMEEDVYNEEIYYEENIYQKNGGSPSIIISLIAGLGLAFVPVLIMKGQLKSVHMQSSAGGYEKRNTRKITVSQDTFLYHTVSRVPRPKENTNRSGGSSTFRGSSGRSHGGRGGGF